MSKESNSTQLVNDKPRFKPRTDRLQTQTFTTI